MSQIHETCFDYGHYFAFNRIDLYMHMKKTIHITVKLCLDEVDYYMKEVTHLLCDKSVTPVEAVHYFSLMVQMFV